MTARPTGKRKRRKAARCVWPCWMLWVESDASPLGGFYAVGSLGTWNAPSRHYAANMAKKLREQGVKAHPVWCNMAVTPILPRKRSPR